MCVSLSVTLSFCRFFPLQPLILSPTQHHPYPWMKFPRAVVVVQLVLVGVVVMAWVRRHASTPLVVEADVVPFTEPKVNGPMKHIVVLPDGAGTEVNVWAHPHNNDPNFDFWSAVGPFSSKPAWDGGWESGQFSAVRRLLHTPQSVYVSIGGWIGPMSLEAATRSHSE